MLTVTALVLVGVVATVAQSSPGNSLCNKDALPEGWSPGLAVPLTPLSNKKIACSGDVVVLDGCTFTTRNFTPPTALSASWFGALVSIGDGGLNTTTPTAVLFASGAVKPNATFTIAAGHSWFTVNELLVFAVNSSMILCAAQMPYENPAAQRLAITGLNNFPPVSSLAPPSAVSTTTTSKGLSATASEQTAPDATREFLTILIGVVAGSVAIGLFAAGLAFFLCRRRRSRSASEPVAQMTAVDGFFSIPLPSPPQTTAAVATKEERLSRTATAPREQVTVEQSRTALDLNASDEKLYGPSRLFPTNLRDVPSTLRNVHSAGEVAEPVPPVGADAEPVPPAEADAYAGDVGAAVAGMEASRDMKGKHMAEWTVEEVCSWVYGLSRGQAVALVQNLRDYDMQYSIGMGPAERRLLKAAMGGVMNLGGGHVTQVSSISHVAQGSSTMPPTDVPPPYQMLSPSGTTPT
ncbi:hypothetical protein HK101_009694 [Irineochytrium annulatum]|nr:hypothetical protein HK101_009694 [Irineochytrium annulatum]